MNILARLLLLLLRMYRQVISPAFTAIFGPMGFGCRFSPTCSVYAMEAICRHGALKGSWLAARRLFRCHPWGGQGADAVPDISCRH